VGAPHLGQRYRSQNSHQERPDEPVWSQHAHVTGSSVTLRKLVYLLLVLPALDNLDVDVIRLEVVVDTVRSDSGVTLLELAVVIAIVGILAVIAGPNISAFSGKYRLTRVANDYAMTVNLARSQAIAFNRQMRVVHVAPDTNPGDSSRTNFCTWDIKARCWDADTEAYVWETIPCDDNHNDGENEGSPKSGYYDYDNSPSGESNKFAKNISMEASGTLTDGYCYEFTTRGTVTSGTDACSAYGDEDAECYVRVAFRNKMASSAGRIQVCVGNPSGITTLHSDATW